MSFWTKLRDTILGNPVAAVASFVIGGPAGLALYAGSSAITAYRIDQQESDLRKQEAQARDAAEAAKRDQKTMIRSAIQARTLVYGTARVSGPIVFAHSTGLNHKYLHLVIPVAGHEIQSVDQVWFNEDRLTIDASGMVTSAPYGTAARSWAHVSWCLGSPDQAASAVMLHDYSTARSTLDFLDISKRIDLWSADHRLRGIAYLYVRLEYNTSIFTSGVPNVSATIRGKKVVGLGGTVGWSNNWARVMRDYIQSTPGLRVSDDEINTVDWSGSVVVADTELTGSDTGLSTWTRSGTVATITAPEGAAPGTVIAIYESSDTAAIGIGDTTLLAGADSDHMTFTCFNAGDTSGLIRYTMSVSVPRYSIDGVVSLDRAPRDIIKRMTASGAGAVLASQGQYRILAGTAGTATATITVSALRGAMRVRASVPRSDLINGVKATYTDPRRGYQQADIPPVSVAAYVTADAGEEVFAELDLEFTASEHVAKHLAIVLLKRSRQGIVVEMPCNLTVFKVAVWDVVNLSVEQLGWISKPFRVTKWVLAPDGAGVDLTLTEEQSSDWDYDPSLVRTVDQAEDTSLPSAVLIGPPTSVTVTERLYQSTPAGGTKTRLHVSWSPPDDAFPVQYRMRWRRSGEVDWHTELTTYADANIDDTSNGQSIEITVAARNVANVWSDPTDTLTHVITGSVAAPSAVAGFAAARVPGGVRLSWTRATEADVTRYAIRTGGSGWSDASPLIELPASTTKVKLPLAIGSHTWRIKAIDQFGTESASAASVTRVVASRAVKPYIR